MSVCCTYKNTWGLHRSVCLKQHREGSSPSRSRGQPWTPGSPQCHSRGMMSHILLRSRGRQPPNAAQMWEAPVPTRQQQQDWTMHTNTRASCILGAGSHGRTAGWVVWAPGPPKGKAFSWSVPSSAQAPGSAFILQEELGTERPGRALCAMGNVTGKRYIISVYFCMARGVVYQRPSSQHCNISASSPCPRADTEPTPRP